MSVDSPGSGLTMWADTLRLVNPSKKYGSSLVAMVREYRSLGEKRYFDVPDLNDYTVHGYLAYLTLRAESYDLKPTHVRQNTYWLVQNGEILGASRLRPILTPELMEWGGHISYDVRPSQRGKGHGTHLLALTLDQARKFRMSSVRLMCYQDNTASKRIIERNGGRLIFAGPCALAGGEIFTFEIEL
jgi:predicted acetyltransferase